MEHAIASRTALGAAGHRAAHQTLEGGSIFKDPLAQAILGPDADDAIAFSAAKPDRRGLRLFIAMRSRFAEDSALRAIGKGVRQILVLGAGFDTFAYRLNPQVGAAVYELDHPATQREKRRRLETAGISEPAHVRYISHDFEREAMTDALRRAGFDPRQETFALWLGVTPYLTEAAVFATLGELAGLPGGAEVVFDYVNPPEAIKGARFRAHHEELAARVAAIGEPLQCAFHTAALHAGARTLGFIDIEDLDRAALFARYLPEAKGPKPGPGAHVVRMAALLVGDVKKGVRYV